MSQAEVAAWWTEVEELRERIERRRSLSSVSAEPARAAAPDLVAPRTESAALAPAAAVSGTRRTVRIRGQAIPTVVAPRLRPIHDQPGDAARTTQPPALSRARPYGTTRPARPRPRPAERMGANPDRLAAWAFALALLTLLVAAISAHGL